MNRNLYTSFLEHQLVNVWVYARTLRCFCCAVQMIFVEHV